MRKIKLILSALFVSIIFSCFSLDAISAESTNTNIEQKEYEGNPYIDVRECYDNEDGERQFTKKGITFNPKLAEQVAEAILQTIKQ